MAEVLRVGFKKTYHAQEDFEQHIIRALIEFEESLSVAEAVGVLEQVKFDLLAGVHSE